VLEQIEESILSYEQTKRKVELGTLIMKMLEDEELYWHKRSHEKWLHEGDNNTKFSIGLLMVEKEKKYYHLPYQ
jgi:hypothetical protein